MIKMIPQIKNINKEIEIIFKRTRCKFIYLRYTCDGFDGLINAYIVKWLIQSS